jgi:glycosyltransferase involved in cell wall biosynthesis
VISSLNPSGGGPMEGVLRRGLFLEKMGHSVSIVTLDDPNEPFLKDFPLQIFALGPSPGTYRYNPKLVPWLLANAGRYDRVIVNGLWQYHSFATRKALVKLAKPYFIFTHGMLDPWFKHTYPFKHLKKWLYWPWGEYRVLRDAGAVLFTSEEERILAAQSFWLYQVRPRVVAYGTSPPPDDAAGLRARFSAQYPELRGRRLLLFLSRIHEKKGCDLLIEAFAKVALSDPALHLMIAGPGDPELIARLKEIASARGIADRISWPGMLKGDLKWGAFYGAEAFVLTSHQENFGIAVAEALGCGLPVLISNRVNIWREILQDNAGLAESDTQFGADSLLRRWLGLLPEVRTQMGLNALKSFQARFKVDAMAHSLIEATSGSAS